MKRMGYGKVDKDGSLEVADHEAPGDKNAA